MSFIKSAGSVIFLWLLIGLSSIGTLVGCVAGCVKEEPSDPLFTLAFLYGPTEPMFESARRGVRAVLEKRGYTHGVNINIVERSTEGGVGPEEIFRTLKADLAVVFSASFIEIITHDTPGFPVLFLGVPSRMKLKNFERERRRALGLTGVWENDPAAELATLAHRAYPERKVFGIPYDPTTPESLHYLKLAEAECEKLAIDCRAKPMKAGEDMYAVLRELAENGADLFLGLRDPAVLKNSDALIDVAEERRIPFFSSCLFHPRDGAALALGIDPYEEGLELGEILVRVLMGEDPGHIAPVRSPAPRLIVCPRCARQQGASLPEEIIEEADQVLP